VNANLRQQRNFGRFGGCTTVRNVGNMDGAALKLGYMVARSPLTPKKTFVARGAQKCISTLDQFHFADAIEIWYFEGRTRLHCIEQFATNRGTEATMHTMVVVVFDGKIFNARSQTANVEPSNPSR